jgi:hypothetical protein
VAVRANWVRSRLIATGRYAPPALEPDEGALEEDENEEDVLDALVAAVDGEEISSHD